MAVTSIWAVRRSIKDLLNYASNPEKTANPNLEDLKQLVNYARNPDKTEKMYFVQAINCLPELAYESMMETKRRYGKYGGIVAYHGYQSFKPGEVTPEECHEIGLKLALELWGDDYEVLIATHVDKSHCHNHFCVNSVSFKNGAKFRCTRSYHSLVMAPASDKLCEKYGLSVIKYKQSKRIPYAAYLAEKNGKVSNRTLLKLDIDDAILDCSTPQHLQFALARRGYTYLRGKEYKHPCVIAKGWKRPVRIDSLGDRYTTDAIEKRIFAQRNNSHYYRPSYPPLYTIWERKRNEQYTVIDIVFNIVLELLGVNTSDASNAKEIYQEPLSPAMRQEQINAERYMEIVNLINRNDLSNREKVEEYISHQEKELEEWIAFRKKIDNIRRRHAYTDVDKENNRTMRMFATGEITKVRHQINLAKEIFPMIDHLKEKLRIEMEQEQEMFPRETGAKNQPKIKRNEEKQR